MTNLKWAPAKLLILTFFALLLTCMAYSQTPSATDNAAQPPGKAKVIFYYGRPVPLKNCLVQVGILIDNVPVHQIFQWHVWQTELAAGTHVFSDDSHKDEKGTLTVSLVAGQTYYYEGQWHKGWGLPSCNNISVRFVEMKPKDTHKASSLLGKPGVDETEKAVVATAVELKPTAVKLSIVSSPEAADIEIDGSFMGNTPSAIELAPGEHNVVVSKAGYKSWQRKIKLATGDIRLNAQLEQDITKP